MSATQVFAKFDKNNDGKLSLQEFHNAALAFCKTFSEGEIKAMFNDMDVDGDGQVGAAEFTSCIEKMLKEVFDFCDVDGDGKIPADGLYVSMTKLGKKCTKDSCAKKVQIADADGDGHLNFEEFMAMVFSDI
ncbi:putative calcium-binding protein CML34 [Raphanus sativus]|uniref:Probable calcium-binding protein CML34 n=1 Tax=Raphanus sativus TaxID=3726 RepID=A0A6J0JI16_RAPSA|nr:probable calcium-binding protein CML34 [Raphanus sativus]XP_056855273.1 probable calcium-binding protein CML34 [Raphanus sativus]KAJ4869025.1 putative calcium-binding protein CML34 [Raphanus sativus]